MSHVEGFCHVAALIFLQHDCNLTCNANYICIFCDCVFEFFCSEPAWGHKQNIWTIIIRHDFEKFYLYFTHILRCIYNSAFVCLPWMNIMNFVAAALCVVSLKTSPVLFQNDAHTSNLCCVSDCQIPFLYLRSTVVIYFTSLRKVEGEESVFITSSNYYPCPKFCKRAWGWKDTFIGKPAF